MSSIQSRSKKASGDLAATPKRSKFDLQQWVARFDELKKYKDEQGACYVPQSQSQFGPLGRWVAQQRQSYNKGKLSQGRIEQLESIGFTWDPLEEMWMARFDELSQYKKQHGDSNVQSRQGQLGKWVNIQRISYKRGKLSQERFEQLESVSFKWYINIISVILP